MSHFTSIKQLPPDPIFRLPGIFTADSHPKKVNLGIGVYKNEKGQPEVLSCVKKAEKLILEQNLSKDYLPIDGLGEYVAESLKLILGETLYPQLIKNIFAAQTVGGTSALRTMSDFLVRNGIQKIFIPESTWPNHWLIFRLAGIHAESYNYYDAEHHELDFNGICNTIKSMPPSSVILFHACCHNPTGIDPTRDQWKVLSQLIKAQKVIPCFDLAYQGFGEGVEEDVYAIRLFAEQGHEMFVTNSYSKNFGLYAERTGLFAMLCNNEEIAHKVGSHIKQIIRSTYSNPPIHGARIVSTILHSESLRKEWLQELATMRHRIKGMRLALANGLKAVGFDQRALAIEKQQGLFSFIGLNIDQVDCLRKEYGIHLPDDGRLNIAGLTSHNIEYVITTIAKVLHQ